MPGLGMGQEGKAEVQSWRAQPLCFPTELKWYPLSRNGTEFAFYIKWRLYVADLEATYPVLVR